MSKNHAVIVTKPGEVAVEEVSVPKLRDDYILVKVKAVALNPTDWKHVDFLTAKGARIGCDYAGVVEEVGSKVTKPFKKGDRICGVAHGGNATQQEDGTFQEYIVAKGDLQIKIPENLTFEEAATLGIGISTVGQALYQSLQLPLPDKPTDEKTALLIHGGSTATGALAIQYAKLSGLTVITTSSPHNFSYVKSLGADAAFDYKDATCSQQIREYSKDSIKYALDCISEGSSTATTVAALSSSGGVYTTLLSISDEEVSKINAKVQNKSTLAYTVIGESFAFGPTLVFPANAGDFEFGKSFWELSRSLLENGSIKVHKPTVDKFGSGLEGVIKGMDFMRQGKLSGEKLVYTIDK